jgi:hypothetical protein
LDWIATMLEQLRLHVRTHIRFFLRNRLVLGLGLAMLGLFALSFVPFVLMDSSGSRFERLKFIVSQLHLFAWFYGGVLAVLGTSSHIRDRSLRLVLTRPASLEVWVASMFVAAFTITAAAHALIATAGFGLSLASGVPYQTGFFWIAIDRTFESLIVISVIGAVGAALHPAMAALAFVFLNETMLNGLLWMVLAAREAGNSSIWLRLADGIVRAVYAAVPMLDPFSSNTRLVGESARATLSDWGYLGAAAAYSGLTALFCFLLTVWVLRRRQL